MAGFSAVYAVGESIAQFLRNTYPSSLRTDHPCRFEVAKSADFADATAFGETVVTLYLYRLAIDQYLNPAGAGRHGTSPSRSLPLDLHFMVTVWTDNKHSEQLLMTWVMAQLHWHPVLDRSNLMALGAWRPDETIQIMPTHLSHEDLTRIWDVVEPSYRLSTTYLVRVVQIDPPEDATAGPVVATRFRVAEGVA
ncbi:MAG: DUF4255 domain-containing protein [Geminicoccaceae bacterium]|nr:MAG: DUF4255 domain-containing protein [Geminicoccaceae bacterium]